MRAVIQRVKRASVEVEGSIVGEIGEGYMILLGIAHNDSERELKWLCDKIKNLRIFSDANGKMNLSIEDINGQILMVSQFTLYADCIKGRRPGFTDAAKGDKAKELYEKACEYLKNENIIVETGVFGADMQVSLVNNGPVTIILDTKEVNL